MKNFIKACIAFFAVVMLALCFVLVYALKGGDMGIVTFAFFPDRFGGGKLVQTQTVDMWDITELNIENNSSDVYFISSDQEKMVIQEYCVSRFATDASVKISRDGNQLNINSVTHKRGSFIFGNNNRYIEVYLPSSYKGSLNLDSGSGDVQAESDIAFAGCSVQTASGDIDFQDLTADHIFLKAGSGDISARRLSGEKELSTGSGDIEISDNVGDSVITTSSGSVWLEQTEGNLIVKTTSGDADIRVTKLNGNLDIQCTSGDIDCKLPETAGFQFKAGTTSGDINTDFDRNLSFDRKGKNAEGTVGEPAEVSVTVQTVSGDIDVTVR